MLRTLPLGCTLLGLVLLYVGERALADTARYVVDGLGGAALLAGLGFAIVRWRQGTYARRRAAAALCFEYGICLLAIVLYWAQTETLDLVAAGKIHTAMTVVWPAVLLLGLLPAAAMEISLASAMRSPTVELWRIRLASRSARIMALAVIGFAGVNYAASAWNTKIDLSYFKTTRPGEATVALVRDAAEAVEFYLFFPPGNDVLEHVRSYVDELATQSPKTKFQVVDQALEPELARKFKVRQNGYLVVATEKQNKSVRLGLDVEDARRTLKKLDAELHKNLIEILRAPRVAYLTSGHEERSWSQHPDDKRPALNDFRRLLVTLGFEVKRLGLAEGLGTEVPEDATLVVVPGALQSFLPSEIENLHTYFHQGGSLFVLVDPDHGEVHDEILAPLGVKVSSALTATDRHIVRVAGAGESVYNFHTSRTASHPSVKTLNANQRRTAAIFIGAGALSKAEKLPEGIQVKFALRSRPQCWLDTTANGRFDKGVEKRTILDLGAAITYERKAKMTGKDEEPDNEAVSARAFVLGDADVAGNGLILAHANPYVMADVVRWLAGDEKTAGTIESEEDVPIVHRKDEDTILFYATSAFAPAAVLAFGLIFTLRRPRRKSAEKESGGA